MAIELPAERMPEAEVSLRLAFYLLSLPGSGGKAEVAIDGAQVRVHGGEIFPIAEFLAANGWGQVHQEGKNPWQGTYSRGTDHLAVHARSGVGDVVAKIRDRRVRAECKQGPLVKRPGSPEFPLLREAIGQVLTVESIEPKDVMTVAVPLTEQFTKLAERWRPRPLLQASGIQIALVGRNGVVEGLHMG